MFALRSAYGKPKDGELPGVRSKFSLLNSKHYVRGRILSSKTRTPTKRDNDLSANIVNQSATRLWRTVAVKLPERAGRHRNSCGVQINQARIPHCNVQMVRSGLNVHCCRSWLGIASGWHLVHCQRVRPRWPADA